MKSLKIVTAIAAACALLHNVSHAQTQELEDDQYGHIQTKSSYSIYGNFGIGIRHDQSVPMTPSAKLHVHAQEISPEFYPCPPDPLLQPDCDKGIGPGPDLGIDQLSGPFAVTPTRSFLKLTTTGTDHTMQDGLDIGILNDQAYIWQNEKQPLTFATDAKQRMSIDENGEITVGFPNFFAPGHLFSVGGDVGVEGHLKIYTGPGATAAAELISDPNGSADLRHRNTSGKLVSLIRSIENGSDVRWEFLDRAKNGTPDAQRLVIDYDGTVYCRELKVKLPTFPDYVFEDSYNLPGIEEMSAHVKEHGRLPGMPSGADIDANGIGIGELQIKMMEKIEELSLYIIELNSKIEALEAAK